MVTNEAPPAASRKRPRLLGGDMSEIAIIVVFLAIVLYLSFTTSSFLSTPNIMSILVASSLIAIVACGQTFVIITGGIDLSSGSVVALSGVLTGLALHANVPIPAAVLLGILVGLACGLFNGFSVTYLNMNPFIVTLAAMAMARGLAFIIPNGQTVFGFDDAFDAIGGGLVGYLPIAGLVAAAALVIGAFVLTKTVFGREVYSVGGNREAAVMAGIPVRRTLMLVYLISGGLAGLGGIILTGRLDSAQPIAANGLELNAIAAVVIGGASLFGGRGSMLGTILGVLLIGVINNGLTLNNVEPFWVQFIQGAVIFLAVLFDSLNQRRRSG
ncbi:ABC transporter permease [Labrys monachus]|uniref:Ribose/xylose/arabinose/galactoside ABC-type transport system permease subunit n=1 Tax=Labrys monachus TaxID=217067 RepID=A0ABU0FLL4_9HYPH|nr:ABC transporter permease [Labrys monachus]MDQ0395498.1 ribose/xylose/arabinose/galactoside ABC-type transport system permease subunit [Labrys monachus]